MTAVGSLPAILQTKLYRPPISEDFVPRARLRNRLEQIIQRPLTLVSAPAGYGKSVLLSAWLEHCLCPGAWLSLDENDNDLSAFVSYLLAAIRGIFPSFGDELLAILNGANLPTSRALVEMLCVEFTDIEEELVLIIDDYGVITSSDIHEFVSKLILHPHPHLHLVLLSRQDPPLPLNEWRAGNKIVEIRGSDLRFSLEETASFVQLALEEQLSQETIIALNRKTEGWAAGLRLATLSFSHIEQFQGQIDELSGSNIYIRDYLVTQVLARLPDEKQRFLLQSSILNRFSAELCQAVAMPQGALADVQGLLQELQAANIFIIPLDDIRHWFRYHHLFQQFLQLRLANDYPPEEVAALRARASAWFAQNGFIEEALHYAIAAGDIEAGVQLVAANRQELMNVESYQRLSRWLQMFPQSIIDSSPDLLLIQARFAQILRYDMAELSQIAERINSLVNTLNLEPQIAQIILAESNTLLSAKHYFSLDPQTTLEQCQNGLALLPQDWYALRSHCWIYGAVALQMLGDLQEVHNWIEKGRYEDLLEKDGSQVRNAAAEGFVCWMAADLTGLQRVGEFMVGVISETSRWQSHGWAHYFLACVHYQRNDLDRARFHAQKTFNKRFVNHAAASFYSAFILALVEQARGRPEEAGEILALATNYAVEIRSTPFILLVQSFAAELAVLQGQASAMAQWAEQKCSLLELSAMPFFYAQQLTIPKALLAEGTADGRRQAAGCLRRLHQFAESTNNTRILIEVLALEALLHAANNDQKAANAALEASIALAHPGGFIRLYLDLGSKIADLLRRLQNRQPYAAYVTMILSAFADDAQPEQQFSDNEQLIEPLTHRESEILQLLDKRLTNKEIAAELFISPATVKRHTINIYQKLAVHNRREAVKAAREQGLILFP